MVVATFYNGVDLRDKVNIWVENDIQIPGGWCGRDVINGKGGIKAFAMTRFAYDYEFGFIRFQLQLIVVHPVLDWYKECWRLWIESLKMDVLKELGTCVSPAYRWCLISLASGRTELRAVVYIINRSGPSTKPWGTPKISSLGLDRVDEIWTLLTTQSSAKPSRPNHSFNLSSKIRWSIVSNAADKSRSIWACFSTARKMSFWTVRRAVSVE